MTALLLPLRPGAAVAVVAPASAPPPGPLAEGLQRLREWGLQPRWCGPEEGREFLAAPDPERRRALEAALADPEVEAVWAARGGYGVVRILEEIAFPVDRPHPPLLLGFSDISLLLAWASGHHGWPACHAPNVTTLPRLDDPSREALQRLLFEGRWTGLEGLKTLRGGRARGTLLPMNLAMLCSVAGTPLQPRLRDAILVLEDTGEAPYRVDRMLHHLARLPDFDRLAGLVVGDLAGALESPTVRETLATLAARAAVPCCFGAPVGHGRANVPLPVGLPVLLDADEGTLTAGAPGGFPGGFPGGGA